MLSIAVFVKNLRSGGAEKQAVLLAKAISGNYNTHFIVYDGDKIHQKYLELLIQDNKIKVCILKEKGFSRWKALFFYLKKEKVSIIFSYLTGANLRAAIIGKFVRVKVFTGIRNVELPRVKKIVDRFLLNYMVCKAIVNNYSGKKNFSEAGFNDNKMIVIPNCFENIKSYREKRYSKKITIITVGRFVPQKDYETAIHTIAELKKYYPNIRFLIIGYGFLDKKIHTWVNQYGIQKVTEIFINPKNIPEYLDNSDIYLSTSLFEGTSNSIMEGMNADLPIVATNVGDNQYLVQNGKNGILKGVRDWRGLAAALLDLCINTEKRMMMGRLSKERLMEYYSVEKFKERYIYLIESMKK